MFSKGKTSSDNVDDTGEESSVEVSIAKWWKQTGHKLNLEGIPKSDNPQTILKFVVG